MKIAFCTRPLKSQHQGRGVGTYTRLLFAALKKEHKNLTIQEFNIDVPEDVDLVHYPFFDPFFLTLPVFKKKPTVVTVHDLTPLIFPQHFKSGLKGSVRWQIQKLALYRSQHVLTDSHSSSVDIKKTVGIDAKKISVVYLAANEIYQPLKKNEIEITAKRYQINKNYFLYVGDVNWNKNIPGLLRAFALFREKYPSLNVKKLLLVGGSFLESNLPEVTIIREVIKNLCLEKDVVFLGQVNDTQLCHLYNLAYVYIQPSFYEGFGLPLLEAMSCGCPILSSNTSSLPEISGKAAVYFDPVSVDSILEAMEKSIFWSEKEYYQQSQSALLQSKQFTWKKTVQETIKAYEKTI